jgi:hypothetical protein
MIVPLSPTAHALFELCTIATDRKVFLVGLVCCVHWFPFHIIIVPLPPTARAVAPVESAVTPYRVWLIGLLVVMTDQLPLYRRIIPLVELPPTAKPELLVIITIEFRFVVVGLVIVTHRVPFHMMIVPPSPTAQALEFTSVGVPVVLLTMLTEFRFELVGLAVLIPTVP